MGPPPDTEQMLNMLENPQFQSSINEALQNPQLIDLMIQQTPMLRDMGPGVRQMLQSPMFRRMLTDPNMIRQVTQMQRAMGMGPFGRAGGGNAAFPAPGVTNTTPQENRDEQQQQPQDPNNAQTPPNPFAFGTFGMPPGQGVAANPFAALFGAFPPPAGGAGGDAANAPGSGTATTQAPSDAAAQGTAGAGASPAPGSTGGAAAGADPNAQNPFASLFNPAFFGTPGAAPNPNSQQAPNPAANPFMNNPFMQDPALFNQMLQAVGGQAQAQNPDNNPFASMFGTGRAQSPPDSRPPEERYAQQLSQLNDMGFYDFDRNVEALRRAGGNVQGAVEYLLSNP
jgi:ubiquilin